MLKCLYNNIEGVFIKKSHFYLLQVAGQSLGSTLQVVKLNFSTDCQIDEGSLAEATCTKSIINIDDSLVTLTGNSTTTLSNICDGMYS